MIYIEIIDDFYNPQPISSRNKVLCSKMKKNESYHSLNWHYMHLPGTSSV